MAETWRARLVGDAGVTKPVLIKKVLPEFSGDEAFIAMFISEARISATLRPLLALRRSGASSALRGWTGRRC